MPSEREQRAKDLFAAAFELDVPDRAAFLAQACADDEAVRMEVADLLRLAADAADFLDHEALLGEAGHSPTEQKSAAAVGRRLGPYQIISELGQGGMGAVFLAERADQTYAQQVAIKLAWPGVNRAAALARFQLERRILARLNHPHIARLLDGGVTEDGWHYLVMEYVNGLRITEYCRQQKLSLVARLQLFRTVCAAVQYAHQNLIVHRDLKPSNIFVTADGAPKLLDFGIAKLLERGDEPSTPSTLTRAAQPAFTPEYASPEQARNETITTASDVYSLGVVLYELLTGARPYQIGIPMLSEIIRAICEQEAERPSARVSEAAAADFAEGSAEKLRQSLRGDLDNIALKALQKEARRRYQTVGQLSGDLENYLTGQPVAARPATLRYRAGKYVRRNKGLVAAASVVLLALLVGALVTFWQLRASQAREREQRRELYAADMRQAGADWGEGNLVHMDELLERHRPGNGVDDEWQGFEWVALWKLLHTEKFTIRHYTSTPAVAFAPDGATLLTGSLQGAIEKWDAYNGQSLGVFAQYPPGIYQLRFFSGGTKLIVNSGYSLHLSIWDYLKQTKLIELQIPLPTLGDYLLFALSPDEKRLITSVTHQPFQMWDTITGQQLNTFPLPLDSGLPDSWAIYSPDGWLWRLARKSNHFIWRDLLARRPDVRLDPQSADPRSLLTYMPIGYVFSPDGKYCYLPTEDFKIRVWDFKRGGKPLQVLTGHEDHVETPAISPDGKLLASGSDDRTLRLWDTQTGKLLVTLKNESQTFNPTFSPDGKYLAAVCMRALRTKVWDIQHMLSSLQAIEGVQTLGLSPDGKLLTYAESTGLGLRDLRTGHNLLTFTDAAFSTCESFDCTGVSADGKLIALRQAEQGDVLIKESATGETRAKLGGHLGAINAIGFSPDGKLVATGGAGDGLIKLWDTATWREQATWRGHPTGLISALDFSPDGRKLASSSYDSTLKVWDVLQGKELFTLGDRSSWVLKTRFSPDGKLLASTDMNFTIKLWDAATGQLARTLKGHANSVYALAFSPDGKRLASGSDDKTVRLWDLQTGTEVTALRGHTARVWHVFFTPDGQTLISSGEDGTRIWRAATEAEVRAHR